MGVIDGEDPKPYGELGRPTKVVAWSFGVGFSIIVLAGAVRVAWAILGPLL